MYSRWTGAAADTSTAQRWRRIRTFEVLDVDAGRQDIVVQLDDGALRRFEVTEEAVPFYVALLKTGAAGVDLKTGELASSCR